MFPRKHHGEAGTVVVFSLTNTSHPLVAVWSHCHLMPVGLVTAVFVFRSQVETVMFLLSHRAAFGKHGHSTEERGLWGEEDCIA